MRRLREFADAPISRPLAAEEVLELHAARLLLLFQHCGANGRMDGLTKMAKLDFFVRYPAFFAVAAAAEGQEVAPKASEESSMVRYHYGPWDKRYYHLLAYLEALGLLSVERRGNSFRMQLTLRGTEVANELGGAPAFQRLVSHMREVKQVLGGKSGTRLKNLVYELFAKEVRGRALGEVIK